MGIQLTIESVVQDIYLGPRSARTPRRKCPLRLIRRAVKAATDEAGVTSITTYHKMLEELMAAK
jgi:hypothetical protein